jgi:hypothetical protein
MPIWTRLSPRLVNHIIGTDYDSPRRFLNISDIDSDESAAEEAVPVEQPVRSRASTPLAGETPDEKKARRLQKLQSTSFFTPENELLPSPLASLPGSGRSTPVRPASPTVAVNPAPLAGMAQCEHDSMQSLPWLIGAFLFYIVCKRDGWQACCLPPPDKYSNPLLLRRCPVLATSSTHQRHASPGCGMPNSVRSFFVWPCHASCRGGLASLVVTSIAVKP